MAKKSTSEGTSKKSDAAPKKSDAASKKADAVPTKATATELKKRLDAALSEVSLAEKGLEGALGALKARPRAEKVSVDKMISEAFIRLRTAHTTLLEIKQLIDAVI